MRTIDNKSIFIGTKIIVPTPETDDSWDKGMIVEVDDFYDDGMIIFSDDNWVEHEIHVNRIQLYNGENN